MLMKKGTSSLCNPYSACPISKNTMAKPKMTGKLAHVLQTTDGAVLRKRGEARDYMTALPDRRAMYRAWQHAAPLLLDGASASALTQLCRDRSYHHASRYDAVQAAHKNHWEEPRCTISSHPPS
jgi:hypothetical protein